MKMLICDRCKNTIVKATSFKMKQTNFFSDCPNKTFHLCENCYDKFIGFLKEKKKGSWITHVDDIYPVDSTEECPFCHAEQRLVGNDDNFCPNCGADMRKECNEETENE